MDLKSLLKADLLLLCEELGIKAEKSMRKPELVAAIQNSNVEEDELLECWDSVKKCKEAEENVRLNLQNSRSVKKKWSFWNGSTEWNRSARLVRWKPNARLVSLRLSLNGWNWNHSV